MSFEFDSQGADEIDVQAGRGGVPLGEGMEPPFFSGVATGAAKGLARGLVAKPALLIGDAATPMLRPGAQAVDRLVGTQLDTWLVDQQKRNISALEDLKSDPLTTGFAGQVVGGLFDLGSSAITFTPEGAALLEGYGRRQELMSQGVDPSTATAGGAIAGAATYVGVKAPVTLGMSAAGRAPLAMARNAAYGGGMSMTSGIAERSSTQELLERAGYPDQAAMQAPFDTTTLAAEFTLGALFSGGAAALETRSSIKGQQAVDAALSVKQVRHAQRDVAPGIPVDAKGINAHARAFHSAMDQTLRNEPVNVGDALADTTFVRPEVGRGQEVKDELQAHVVDLLPLPAFQPPASAPRGVRSNNPGNLRATGERWQGQVGADGGFITFDSPQTGIRAMAKTLMTYQDRHGLNTVEGIIGRWAPPGENNTPAYVRAVAQVMGIEPTARLDVHDPATMRSLVEAIVQHENGQQPYPDALIRAGIDDALTRRPSPGAASTHLANDASAQAPSDEGQPRVTAAEAASSQQSEPETRLSRFENSVLAKPSEPSLAPAEEVRRPAPARPSRVADLPPMPVGPGVVEPREIATGRPLYRETSVQGLGDLLMDDARAHARQMFVTDNRDLAIGQAENTGVHVVFREGALSGREHRKPGTGDIAGREYRTDMVAPRAIESFTVPAGFKPKALRGLARRALDDFEAKPQQDGSTRYTRRAKTDPQPSKAPAAAEATSTEPVLESSPAPETADSPPSESGGPRAADPTLQAAMDAVTARPDMLVALEDGTHLPAAEFLARAEADRVQAEQDARAFEAAAHCFLRS